MPAGATTPANDSGSTVAKPAIPASSSLDALTAVTGESLVTPEQAMVRVEARRAWAFSVSLAILCTSAIGIVLLLGGDPLAQRLHIATLAATALAAGANAVWNRDPKRYRAWLMMVMTFVSLTADATGYLYWGVYSAFIGVVSVSGYGFASGTSNRRSILVATVLVVLAHVGLGVAIVLGWIAERGLVVPQPTVPAWGQLVLLGVLQIVVIGAIVGGMDARATVHRVLGEHHAALRALAQREAQLAEANEAVRQARAPGEGRYTKQSVGRFRLGLVLGRGAMGEVYAAEDEKGAAFAVKVLASNLLDSEDALRRFFREAHAIANVDSPNIVRLVEVSPHAASLPYLAMERLVGRDLGEMIKEQPVRELGEVVEIVSAVAAGLDAAHAAGVVHRDLKPANVYAARTEMGVVWKVLDFGVAKVGGDAATMTADHVVGTPGYMSPEQARGEPAIDRRADVYSLGVLAYRLLTGRPVVVPGDLPAMLHEVVYKMPLQPSQIASVSPAVEAVLAVALAKSPDDRFETAGALASALRDAAAGRSSPEIVARAAGIVARTPWGHWLRRADRARV
jgi:tRNA A-37 threonylcarbamoyl transferase component Bud32